MINVLYGIALLLSSFIGQLIGTLIARKIFKK